MNTTRLPSNSPILFRIPHPSPKSPIAIVAGLAAALGLACLPVAAQTLTNGGFEDGTLPADPGYGTIPGWTGTPANKTGLNTTAGPFFDNSSIPQGARVGFMQAGTPNGPASLTTTVTGLSIGTKYHVALRANARSGTVTRPWVRFSTAGLPADVNAEVQATGANPYHFLGYDFVATAASQDITISNSRPATAADNTLVIDDVKIAPATGAWDFSAWNNDDDSGVSPYHVYTHAFNMGGSATPVINGVPFVGRTSGLPGSFTTTGLTLLAGFSPGVIQVTGDGAVMAADFNYEGNLSLTLQGLAPSTPYVFTLYGAGWDAPAGTTPYRAATFSSSLGGERLTVNLNQYGQNKGMKVSYAYTTDALGSPVTISYPATSLAAGTFHTSGFSNRKAGAMVGVAPMIGKQPAGAIISPGSSYTLKVGATGSPSFTYQWKRNGVAINGQTSSSLALSNVTFADSGDYSVTVSNGSGDTPSAVAPVLVLDKIASGFGTGVGPTGTPLVSGSDPHYSLITNPYNPASTSAVVQTTLPGAWLPNAATTTSRWIGPLAYSLPAAGQATDAGEGPGVYVYRTQLDLTGQAAILARLRILGNWMTDNRGTGIRINGTDTGIAQPFEGNFGVFRPFVIASGLIAGVNNIDFVVTNTDPVTGFTGLRVDSLGAFVVPPDTAPRIVRQPAGGNAPRNDTFTLSVDAFASAPLSYQWYKDGVVLEGETGAYLQILVESASVAGDYKVTVTDGIAPVESAVATVTVPNNAPVAVPDQLAASSNTPLDIAPFFDLLSNDTDAEIDDLTLASFSPTSANGGTLAVSDDLIIYTPPLNFAGVDTFTYTVSDDWGGTSAAGTVTITVTGAAVPPGPVTLAVSPGGGSVSASFTGSLGATYTLQRSPNLAAGSWSNIGTGSAAPSGEVVISDNSPLIGRAYYRISYIP